MEIMDPRPNKPEDTDAMEEIDDPWTTGLQRDYPYVYARLERFLDYCAECSGNPRVRDEPKKVNNKAAMYNTISVKKRGERQRRAQDAKNLVDLIRLVNGEITEEELIAERGYKNRDSVRDSMYVTNHRGGFGEHACLYERWRNGR